MKNSGLMCCHLDAGTDIVMHVWLLYTCGWSCTSVVYVVMWIHSVMRISICVLYRLRNVLAQLFSVICTHGYWARRRGEWCHALIDVMCLRRTCWGTLMGLSHTHTHTVTIFYLQCPLFSCPEDFSQSYTWSLKMHILHLLHTKSFKGKAAHIFRVKRGSRCR